eukprot:1868341-Karenia_brevis.AAC.1
MMKRAIKQRRGQSLTSALHFFKEHDEEIFQSALGRVQLFDSEDVSRDFAERVERTAKRRLQTAERRMSFAARWRKALARRQYTRK